MKTDYLIAPQADFIKNWATACQHAISHSNHTPLLSKFKMYGGYTLHIGYRSDEKTTIDVLKGAVEEWDNALDNLERDGFIQIAQYRGNLTEYRFTSMAAVEQILAL